MPVLQYGTREQKKWFTPEDKEFKILDTRFLETPALAIEQSRNAARNMAQEAKQALRIALTLIDDYSEEKALQVQKIESKVDRYEDELGTYLVNLSHKNLTLEDSQDFLDHASLHRRF